MKIFIILILSISLYNNEALNIYDIQSCPTHLMEGLEALYALKYQAAELTNPEVTMQKIANDAVFI